MKILQVVDFFKPSWEAGGIVRVFYELSKRLTDKGHENNLMKAGKNAWNDAQEYDMENHWREFLFRYKMRIEGGIIWT